MNWLRRRWFDLTTGLPTAMGSLRQQLGTGRFLRLLAAYGWRSVSYRRPKALDIIGPGARFTWGQLRPVLILDQVLHRDLGLSTGERLRILGEVVAVTGAAFIASQVGVGAAQWRKLEQGARQNLAKTILARFGNARAQLTHIAADELAFRVDRCHFVELTRQAGRPELASLFCAADARLFGANAEVQLQRTTTMAEGGDCCPFRFSLLPEDV